MVQTVLSVLRVPLRDTLNTLKAFVHVSIITMQITSHALKFLMAPCKGPYQLFVGSVPVIKWS